ncbi:hypothetical protein KQX54_007570 [Cotesia glomerata]|uniref:Venom protein n=1 Tax=Cotesia glomerata TaxID=32391 RepID=A0AAV7IDT9_COTGL|nr:hypothetical protein KQX54_007570 [Cotesia glomerata]
MHQTMIPKYLFMFILSFIVVNSIQPIIATNIYDLKSIVKFMDDIEVKIYNDYQLTNITLSENEKNKILEKILIDLTNLLEELNKVTDDKRGSVFGLRYFMKLLQEYKIKNNYPRSDSVESYLILIDEKRQLIESYAGSLLFIRDRNSFDDIGGFCPFVPKITRALNALKYHGQHYERVYEKLMTEILSDMKEEENSNFCGLTFSFQQGIFDYYRLAMTSYLKKFIMFYFLQIFKDRCGDNMSMDPRNEKLNLISDFSKNMMLTKNVLKNVRHYMHRCDVKKFEKLNKESYYELERMIQAIIIEEKDLTASRDSCSENCNLRDTIDHAECTELYECRFIDSSLDICELSYEDPTRRYAWFRDSNGVIYGDNNNEKCPRELRSVYSYYNPLGLTYCDYCVCSCVRKSKRE